MWRLDVSFLGMTTGGSNAIHREVRPPSLKDIQSSQVRIRKKLQTTESRRDFYLAMWKSAPYAFIAAISALALTFYTPSQPIYSIGPFHLPVLSAGPIIVAVLVVAIGSYGGWKQRVLGEEIAQSTIELEDIEKQLERRITKVEAQFINSRPSDSRYRLDSIAFNEQLKDAAPYDFSAYLVPQLLEDMKQLDGDLVDLMSRLFKNEVEFHSRLVTFYEEAKSGLDSLDQAMGVTGTESSDRQSNRVRALYLVLGGLVTSHLDVQQQPNRNAKVYTRAPEEGHFIQLLLSSEDSKNPYPSLLDNEGLEGLAADCEKSRTDALASFTMIDRIITVKYVQPEYRPGI
jgi:hypothetical protein